MGDTIAGTGSVGATGSSTADAAQSSDEQKALQSFCFNFTKQLIDNFQQRLEELRKEDQASSA